MTSFSFGNGRVWRLLGYRLVCVIGAVCWALAYASELSDRMLAASARFTGAATLALIRDICSRSGSCSPTWDSSSSFERASALLASFGIVNLLFGGRLAARLRSRRSVLLNDGAIAAGRGRRGASVVTDCDCGVHVGRDVDAIVAVTDEF